VGVETPAHLAAAAAGVASARGLESTVVLASVAARLAVLGARPESSGTARTATGRRPRRADEAPTRS